MGLKEMLEQEGFTPTANESGFPKYKGIYFVSWDTLRKETGQDGGCYWIAEWSIHEVLDGMMKRDSQYADLRATYSFDLEGDTGVKKLKELLKNIFTFGKQGNPPVELDISSSDAFAESAQEKLIGTMGYVEAFPKKKWKQVDGEWVEDTGLKQGVKVLKAEDAEKKRKLDVAI